MSQTKAFYLSRGFWGPIVSLLGFISMQRGWGEIDVSGVLAAIEQLFAWGGLVLAFIGRIRARERLTLGKKATGGSVSTGTAAGVAMIVLAALWLAACAPRANDVRPVLDAEGNVAVSGEVSLDVGVDQGLAVFCRGYTGTLRALVVFRPEMTADQVTAVESSIDVVRPLCMAAAAGSLGDPHAALETLRAELRALLILEREMKS